MKIFKIEIKNIPFFRHVFEILGNFNGTLSKVPASDLGSIAIKEVLTRGQLNAADVDEVIIGQVSENGNFMIMIIIWPKFKEDNQTND